MPAAACCCHTTACLPPHLPACLSSPFQCGRYCKLEVLDAAVRKHGSLQGLEQKASQAKAAAGKRKAKLASGEEERREEMEEALEAVGLTLARYQRQKVGC